MNKNIHDSDDFFKDAYQQFEEEPSADLWHKITTRLDKKEAVSNRRKFVVWRRAAIVLLLILTGFVLFDSHIFNKGSRHSTDNKIAKKHKETKSSGKRNELNDENEIIPKHQKEATRISAKKNNLPVKQNDIAGLSPYPNTGRKPLENKTTTNVKHRLVNAQFIISIAGANPPKKLKVTLNNNETVRYEKIMTDPLIERTDARKPIAGAITGNGSTFSIIENDVLKNMQSNHKKRPGNNSFRPYWLMTAFATYDRVNYKLDSDLPDKINSIKHGEVHEPSFSGGIYATRQLTKQWGLQTGISYSMIAIGISPQKLHAIQNPAGNIAFKYVTSSGYAYIKPGLGVSPAIGDSLFTMEGKHTLKMLSVPLMLKYTAGINKFTITPGAGIEANFITAAQVEIEIDHPVKPEIVFIDQLDGAKSFYISVIADAELRYRVNKKLSANLRPVFRYALTPITKNNVVETFPYSFGAGFGMTYKF